VEEESRKRFSGVGEVLRRSRVESIGGFSSFPRVSAASRDAAALRACVPVAETSPKNFSKMSR
jgi:hypothetical protein